MIGKWKCVWAGGYDPEKRDAELLRRATNGMINALIDENKDLRDEPETPDPGGPAMSNECETCEGTGTGTVHGVEGVCNECDGSGERNKAATPQAYKELLRLGGISAMGVRFLLREIVERDFDSIRDCGRKWKLSAPYLSDCLSGKRAPGPAILRRMGLQKIVAVRYEAE